MTKKKILIVDDEQDHVIMLAIRLQANGYTVESAMGGVQAVMVAHREKPDLIILDIKMPDQSGFAVFENLRASSHTRSIPILFLSAFSYGKVKDRVDRLDAQGFISKPFDSGFLLEKIDAILDNEEDNVRPG